jgi:23S rRNA pseudouridine955/2504/2580 synthase
LQKLGLKRMFLHAWRLQFTHPASAERVALQADLPPELHALMPPAALDALATHPFVQAHD